MRLTLRTMLAYMDDILDPEDAEAIGQKIKESEFATTLLHRTRDVMRRLRLGTPNVTDRGAGLDPNTVAEYLDNTLADDRVLDFEKVCLESDVHLAEVASCHQVLALVLGEPAEVDGASRQRMYRLVELVDAQLEAATGAAALSGAADLAAKSQTEARGPRPLPAAGPVPAKSGVPQRPREEAPKRRGWWPTAATVGVVVIGVVLLLAVTGQFTPGSFLGNFLGSGQTDRSMVWAPDSTNVRETSPGEGPSDVVGRGAAGPSETVSPAPEPGGPDGLTTDFPSMPSSEPTASTEPGRERQPPHVPADMPGPIEQADELTPTDKLRIPEISEPVRPRQELPVAVPGIGAAEERGSGQDAPAVAGPTTSPLAQPPVTDVTVSIRDPASQSAGERGAQPGGQPGTQPPVAAAPFPPEPVGQLDAPSQVLLWLDAETATWKRMANEAPLMSQTSYLSLPTYRPMLRLVDQTQVWLIDGTKVELLPTGQEGVAGLVVEYGRLVIETPQEAGSRLRLKVGDRSGMITFGAAGSRLALEVSRSLASNNDPETQPAPLMAALYATSGKILWQEQGGREPVAVNAPVRLTLNEQPLEALAVEQFPAWIVADTMSLLDQRASGTVEKELAVGRSAVLGLRELADHRRREVRWLGLRCLDYVGDFGLMVTALDNPDENTAWPDYVEQLRAAVVRSPRAAGQVRTAMEKLHGSEGANLYEMLWKYNQNTLDDEDSAHLVEYLEHDTLAFRVVGFQTLKRITRLGISYRPEDSAEKRQPWIQKWKQRLRSSPGAWAEGQGGQQPLSDGEDPFSEESFPQ